MAMKWNLIVDIERCNNCRVCFLAVKDEHIGNDFPGYAAAQPAQGHNWMEIERKERGSYPIVEANFMPVMCNHCDDPPCMKAAQGGAVSKRADGIVIIDPQKSKGQQAIKDACPYGAVSWNEEQQIPQAWIFDAHLLDDGWTQTRAEQCCPTDVFRSVKVDDQKMQQIKEQEGLEVLQPELGARPRVYYKNLHLMTQCFVAGSVVVQVNGVEECDQGAEVILKQNGGEVGRAMTDLFGEFKIDGLQPGSGQYELEISGSGGSLSKRFELGDASLYLGALTA
ncbi:MAG: oxidoreductase [Gammaproteobacteria bacterium]|nr:oxidoreductase [Gammaproteobacteria bacterium]MDP7297350.1 oxidoreductase [Gammaproteobacteria bacterium]MDP7420181.1 oxidoreductase [Gammaproteobacteria bacterium]HJP38916.1 4Fe-4S dicluster domain-containing protein [Gammaproteobacteria bacterium]